MACASEPTRGIELVEVHASFARAESEMNVHNHPKSAANHNCHGEEQPSRIDAPARSFRRKW
jgi:hypothetical protein